MRELLLMLLGAALLGGVLFIGSIIGRARKISEDVEEAEEIIENIDDLADSGVLKEIETAAEKDLKKEPSLDFALGKKKEADEIWLKHYGSRD